jgi:aryl-alcohol dehydrogenase-like predicted oxidoreductase
MSLDTVPLGRTGLSVSELALGTWRFGRSTAEGSLEIDKQQAHDLLDAYVAAGGTFIDTADMYGDGRAESYIGEWLAGRDRESVVIASKLYWPTREGPNGHGLNRKHLRRSLSEILDRLGTDYLDLLYVHRWDDTTPVETFMRTLDGFVSEGRVLHLGASTFEPNAWKVTLANEVADRKGYEPFRVVQPRFNAINREIEGPYLEMCDYYGLGVVPWSPLAGGFLTGKYERDSQPPPGSRGATDEQFVDSYLTEANFDAIETIRAVDDDVGATPAQVSLAWLLDHARITAPIVGARTVDQLQANMAASDVQLTDDQFERIAAVAR